jgi:outer membrane receptor protein involved in Fe transport
MKFSGSYPLPYRVMVSGTFQIYDTPGAGLFLTPPYYAANQTVNAGILGRPFTGGTNATGSSANVNLLEPNTIFADYYKIFDLRVSKSMTVGRHNINALAEFDNLLNMRNVVSVTENYGANWLRPASVQRGRNIRFGIQYRF